MSLDTTVLETQKAMLAREMISRFEAASEQHTAHSEAILKEIAELKAELQHAKTAIESNVNRHDSSRLHRALRWLRLL
jgi:hypothetical protein